LRGSAQAISFGSYFEVLEKKFGNDYAKIPSTQNEQSMLVE